jgi:hypothetical protein
MITAPDRSRSGTRYGLVNGASKLSLQNRRCSALVHFPKSIGLVPEFQQSVLGIVPLATVRAYQIPVPGRSAAIVVVGNRKSRAAAARNKEHPEPFWSLFLGTVIPRHNPIVVQLSCYYQEKGK